ncbi:MAG TPA: hypothetical protein DCZ40_08785 [Lachnospiraceae bacterium]|nr:hypothetical protein [Lachnospiraceae bacterium]
MKRRKKWEGMDILLFLDVDGVLNTSDSFHTRYQLEPDNVKALVKLMERFSLSGGMPKLVLTSTWRLGYDSDLKKCSPQIQKLIGRLGEYGIFIYDKTPIYKNTTRDIDKIVRRVKEYGG